MRVHDSSPGWDVCLDRGLKMSNVFHSAIFLTRPCLEEQQSPLIGCNLPTCVLIATSQPGDKQLLSCPHLGMCYSVEIPFCMFVCVCPELHLSAPSHQHRNTELHMQIVISAPRRRECARSSSAEPGEASPRPLRIEHRGPVSKFFQKDLTQ